MNKVGRILEYFNTIPNVNRGGCGIVALSMIRKFPDKISSIVALYHEFEDYEFNNDKENMINGTLDNVADHYCIRIKDGTLLDSNGEIDHSNYPFELDLPSEDFMLEVLNDGTWNDEFDREYWKPIIEKKLKIDLSDIIL